MYTSVPEHIYTHTVNGKLPASDITASVNSRGHQRTQRTEHTSRHAAAAPEYHTQPFLAATTQLHLLTATGVTLGSGRRLRLLARFYFCREFCGGTDRVREACGGCIRYARSAARGHGSQAASWSRRKASCVQPSCVFQVLICYARSHSSVRAYEYIQVKYRSCVYECCIVACL
jgi:hypothetical protein